MLYYKVTKKIYQNRLELRKEIGINAYKRECKNGNVIYLNNQ